MGSGSSKEEKKPESGRETSKTKPVANVNKQGTPANNNTGTEAPDHQSRSQPPQNVQNTFITQPADDNTSLEERNNRINANGTELSKQTRRDDEDPSSDYARGRTRTTQNRSVWKADKATEDELNEVLRMPTTDHRQTARSVNSVSPIRQEDLPETYAQRKQREQYTLNQQMLLRQKTIYRNPDDWKNEEEEEDFSRKGGFDPSKFRSVNKGQPVKSTVFTTSMRQDGDIQYMSRQQNMDDFDVAPHHPRDLPVYNQSEQDLMASLEREIIG